VKLSTAIICVAAGIWLAYHKPEIADQAIGYINAAVDYASVIIDELKKALDK
jgi:hypothetical protein